MKKHRHNNIWKRTIAAGVVCLFLANQLAWAYPDALATEAGRPEVYEKIRDRMDEVFKDIDAHDKERDPLLQEIYDDYPERVIPVEAEFKDLIGDTIDIFVERIGVDYDSEIARIIGKALEELSHTKPDGKNIKKSAINLIRDKRFRAPHAGRAINLPYIEGLPKKERRLYTMYMLMYEAIAGTIFARDPEMVHNIAMAVVDAIAEGNYEAAAKALSQVAVPPNSALSPSQRMRHLDVPVFCGTALWDMDPKEREKMLPYRDLANTTKGAKRAVRLAKEKSTKVKGHTRGSKPGKAATVVAEVEEDTPDRGKRPAQQREADRAILSSMLEDIQNRPGTKLARMVKNGEGTSAILEYMANRPGLSCRGQVEVVWHDLKYVPGLKDHPANPFRPIRHRPPEVKIADVRDLKSLLRRPKKDGDTFSLGEVAASTGIQTNLINMDLDDSSVTDTQRARVEIGKQQKRRERETLEQKRLIRYAVEHPEEVTGFKRRLTPYEIEEHLERKKHPLAVYKVHRYVVEEGLDRHPAYIMPKGKRLTRKKAQVERHKAKLQARLEEMESDPGNPCIPIDELAKEIGVAVDYARKDLQTLYPKRHPNVKYKAQRSAPEISQLVMGVVAEFASKSGNPRIAASDISRILTKEGHPVTTKQVINKIDSLKLREEYPGILAFERVKQQRSGLRKRNLLTMGHNGLSDKLALIKSAEALTEEERAVLEFDISVLNNRHSSADMSERTVLVQRLRATGNGDAPDMRRLHLSAWDKLTPLLEVAEIGELGDVVENLTPREREVVGWCLDQRAGWNNEIRAKKLSAIEAADGEPDKVGPDGVGVVFETARAKIEESMPALAYTAYFGREMTLPPVQEESQAGNQNATNHERITDAVLVDGCETITGIEGITGLPHKNVEGLLRSSLSDLRLYVKTRQQRTRTAEERRGHLELTEKFVTGRRGGEPPTRREVAAYVHGDGYEEHGLDYAKADIALLTSKGILTDKDINTREKHDRTAQEKIEARDKIEAFVSANHPVTMVDIIKHIYPKGYGQKERDYVYADVRVLQQEGRLESGWIKTKPQIAEERRENIRKIVLDYRPGGISIKGISLLLYGADHTENHRKLVWKGVKELLKARKIRKKDIRPTGPQDDVILANLQKAADEQAEDANAEGAGVTQAGVLPHRGMGHVNECIVHALGKNIRRMGRALRLQRRDYVAFENWYLKAEPSGVALDNVPSEARILIKKLSAPDDYIDIPDDDGGLIRRLRIVRIPVSELGRVNGIPFYGHVSFREGIIWVASDRKDIDIDATILHEANEYNRAHLKALKRGWDMITMAEWRDGQIPDYGGFEAALEFFNEAHVLAWQDVIEDYRYDYRELAKTIPFSDSERKQQMMDLAELERQVENAERQCEIAKAAVSVEIPHEAGAAVVARDDTEDGKADAYTSEQQPDEESPDKTEIWLSEQGASGVAGMAAKTLDEAIGIGKVGWKELNAQLARSPYHERLGSIGRCIPVLSAEDRPLFSQASHLKRVEKAAIALADAWKQRYSNGQDTGPVSIDPHKLKFFCTAGQLGAAPFGAQGRAALAKLLGNGAANGATLAHTLITREFAKIQKGSRLPHDAWSILQEAPNLSAEGLQSIPFEARLAVVAGDIIKLVEDMVFGRVYGLLDSEEDRDLYNAFSRLFGDVRLENIERAETGELDTAILEIAANFIERCYEAEVSEAAQNSKEALSKYLGFNPETAVEIRNLRLRTSQRTSESVSKVYDIDLACAAVGRVFTGLKRQERNSATEALIRISRIEKGDLGILNYAARLNEDGAFAKPRATSWKEYICRDPHSRLYKRKRQPIVSAVAVEYAKGRSPFQIAKTLRASQQKVWLALQQISVEGSIIQLGEGVPADKRPAFTKSLRASAQQLVHLSRIIRQPFVLERLHLKESNLPELPADASEINYSNAGEVLENLKKLLDLLEGTYSYLSEPFDELFGAGKKGKLHLSGDLAAVFRYNLIYLRHKGKSKKPGARREVENIGIRELTRKLGKDEDYVSRVERGIRYISLEDVDDIAATLGDGSLSFNDVRAPDKDRLLFALHDARPLDELRTIGMAMETANARFEKKRIAKDTSYSDLLRLCVHRGEGQEKDTFVKVRLNAQAALRYNLRLARKMGNPKEQLKKKRSKRQYPKAAKRKLPARASKAPMAKYIASEDIGNCIHRNYHYVDLIENGSPCTVVTVHAIASELAKKSNFDLDRIADDETDRFRAVVEMLFDIDTVHQAGDITMAAETLAGTWERRNMGKRPTCARIVNLAIPTQTGKSEWKLSDLGSDLPYDALGYNLRILRGRACPSQHIRDMRERGKKKTSRKPKASGRSASKSAINKTTTGDDIGNIMRYDHKMTGNLERRDANTSPNITTLHALFLQVSKKGNFGIDGIPADLEDRFAAVVDFFLGTKKLEELRTVLIYMQDADNAQFRLDDKPVTITVTTPLDVVAKIAIPTEARKGELTINPGTQSYSHFKEGLNRLTGRGAAITNDKAAEALHITRGGFKTVKTAGKPFTVTRVHNIVSAMSRLREESYEASFGQIFYGPGAGVTQAGVLPHRGYPETLHDRIIETLKDCVPRLIEKGILTDEDARGFLEWAASRVPGSEPEDESHKLPVAKLVDGDTEIVAYGGRHLRVVRLPADVLGTIKDKPFYAHIGIKEGIIWVAADRPEASVEVDILHETEEYNIATARAADWGWSIERMALWRDGRYEDTERGGFDKALEFFKQAHIKASSKTIETCWGRISNFIKKGREEAYPDEIKSELAMFGIAVRMRDNAETAPEAEIDQRFGVGVASSDDGEDGVGYLEGPEDLKSLYAIPEDKLAEAAKRQAALDENAREVAEFLEHYTETAAELLESGDSKLREYGEAMLEKPVPLDDLVHQLNVFIGRKSGIRPEQVAFSKDAFVMALERLFSPAHVRLGNKPVAMLKVSSLYKEPRDPQTNIDGDMDEDAYRTYKLAASYEDLMPPGDRKNFAEALYNFLKTPTRLQNGEELAQRICEGYMEDPSMEIARAIVKAVPRPGKIVPAEAIEEDAYPDMTLAAIDEIIGPHKTEIRGEKKHTSAVRKILLAATQLRITEEEAVAALVWHMRMVNRDAIVVLMKEAKKKVAPQAAPPSKVVTVDNIPRGIDMRGESLFLAVGERIKTLLGIQLHFRHVDNLEKLPVFSGKSFVLVLEGFHEGSSLAIEASGGESRLKNADQALDDVLELASRMVADKAAQETVNVKKYLPEVWRICQRHIEYSHETPANTNTAFVVDPAQLSWIMEDTHSRHMEKRMDMVEKSLARGRKVIVPEEVIGSREVAEQLKNVAADDIAIVPMSQARQMAKDENAIIILTHYVEKEIGPDCMAKRIILKKGDVPYILRLEGSIALARAINAEDNEAIELFYNRLTGRSVDEAVRKSINEGLLELPSPVIEKAIYRELEMLTEEALKFLKSA